MESPTNLVTLTTRNQTFSGRPLHLPSMNRDIISSYPESEISSKPRQFQKQKAIIKNFDSPFRIDLTASETKCDLNSPTPVHRIDTAEDYATAIIVNRIQVVQKSPHTTAKLVRDAPIVLPKTLIQPPMLQKLPPGESKTARIEPSQIKIMRGNLQRMVRDKSPIINSFLQIGPIISPP